LNFLADESVDGPEVYRLRERGYRVQYIAELDPGVDDEVVLAMSRDLEAIRITARQGLRRIGLPQAIDLHGCDSHSAA